MSTLFILLFHYIEYLGLILITQLNNAINVGNLLAISTSRLTA